MTANLKPHSIKRRPLQASGRYCDHTECLQPAKVLITFRKVLFFGRSVLCSRRLCVAHAAPAEGMAS
jgi:hypothetical protein